MSSRASCTECTWQKVRHKRQHVRLALPYTTTTTTGGGGAAGSGGPPARGLVVAIAPPLPVAARGAPAPSAMYADTRPTPGPLVCPPWALWHVQMTQSSRAGALANRCGSSSFQRSVHATVAVADADGYLQY